MIDKHSPASQFTFDIPEPKIRQHVPPAGWRPFDDYPELSGEVALDFETDDPGLQARRGSSWATPGEGFVCGFSISSAKGSFYVGVQHSGGNGDPDKAWRWLAAQAKKPDVTFLYANAIYDLGWMLARHRIDPINAPIDVQGMAALLDAERGSYRLDALAKDFLGRSKGTQSLDARARDIGIPNAISNMKRLPTWIVAPYGIDDAEITRDLYYKFLPALVEQDLMRVFELERECLLVGRDLKMRGVRVDVDRAAKTNQHFIELRDSAILRIKELTNVNISAWDNVSIARAMHAENPTLELEKTSTGKESIRQGVIEALHTPVSDAVIRVRKLDKAISTFFSGYIEEFTTRNGRIHADFHPLRRTRDDAEGGGNAGAGPGRWSSSGPNLQNIPRRDPEIGPAIRSCFLPEEGDEWLKLDYSSQEPRLATHFAHATRGYPSKRGNWYARPPDWEPFSTGQALPGAADMVALYNANPAMSFHKEVGRRMGLPSAGAAYDALKINNLALIYGMSGKTFCHNNGYPTKWEKNWKDELVEVAGDEGQALLDKHAEAVPWGKPLAAISRDAAKIRGYVKTILGRRIRFTRRYADGRLMDVSKALNNAVQGSAADQMKTAQVAFRRAGIPVLVVVHDDGNISKPRGEAGERMLRDASEIMASAIQLAVPSLAESKVGATWGDVG